MGMGGLINGTIGLDVIKREKKRTNNVVWRHVEIKFIYWWRVLFFE